MSNGNSNKAKGKKAAVPRGTVDPTKALSAAMGFEHRPGKATARPAKILPRMPAFESPTPRKSTKSPETAQNGPLRGSKKPVATPLQPTAKEATSIAFRAVIDAIRKLHGAEFRVPVRYKLAEMHNVVVKGSRLKDALLPTKAEAPAASKRKGAK